MDDDDTPNEEPAPAESQPESQDEPKPDLPNPMDYQTRGGRPEDIRTK